MRLDMYSTPKMGPQAAWGHCEAILLVSSHPRREPMQVTVHRCDSVSIWRCSKLVKCVHKRDLRAYLLCQVQAGEVGDEEPGDEGAGKGDGPCDPEFDARTDVVEPHRDCYAGHLCSRHHRGVSVALC